jgi:hypothetical protein
MAWNDPNEVFIAGTGGLNLAPVGTALPTTPDEELNALFIGVGYTSEEGVSFKDTPDVTEHRAWQSTDAIRRAIKARDREIGLEMLQWNEETVLIAFGGGAVTGSGPYTYTLPVAGEAIPEYAVVLDVVDGDRVMRICNPRMSITDAVEAQFNADKMAGLPIVLKSLASTTPTTILFNDAAAFAAGS